MSNNYAETMVTKNMSSINTDLDQQSFVSIMEFKKDKLQKPDIAGVTTPLAITIEVPASTNISRSFFRVSEASSLSLILRDLSSSADGTFSLKLDIRASDGSWFGRRLTFACRQINEYKAKVPPGTDSYREMLMCAKSLLKHLRYKGVWVGAYKG